LSDLSFSAAGPRLGAQFGADYNGRQADCNARAPPDMGLLCGRLKRLATPGPDVFGA